MPVAGVPAETIGLRADYFRQMIETQIASSAFREFNLTYHLRTPSVMSHVYFAMSEAYKRKYLKVENKTDAPKRAAITCAAVSAVQPIRPPTSVNSIDIEEYLYVNPMLAMRMACSIINHPFEKRPFDARRRIYRAIAELKFDSVGPILLAARTANGELNDDWTIELSENDEACINLLIEDFSIYQMFSTPEQSNR